MSYLQPHSTMRFNSEMSFGLISAVIESYPRARGH